MKKVAKIIAGFLLLLIMVVGIWGWLANEPRPQVNPSAEADQLAKKILLAINDSAWQQTKALAWVFQNEKSHIWDRERNYHRGSWGDYVIWMDLSTRKGVAEKAGQRLSGQDLEDALALAWANWCNDAFWLNPISKIFDEGTTRSIVEIKGQQCLMVSYSNGGVTPGDAYVWVLDENHRPKAWKMWVSVIPIGGLETSWEGWEQLPTGAWVSDLHKIAGGRLSMTTITNIKGDTSLLSMTGGKDPFEVLYQK